MSGFHRAASSAAVAPHALQRAFHSQLHSSQRPILTARAACLRHSTCPKPPLQPLSSRLHYSSLRRPNATSSSRGGRITARTNAPSRARILAENNKAALAGAAPVINSQHYPVPDNQAIVQGLDAAATPAVVPDDPSGVLQPHDTAAQLLGQSALVMTRQVEMMNVLVGFEQANKYAIVDPNGQPIGFIAEEDASFTKAMGRQLLRTHRPFKASVFDLQGNEVLKIHRPFAFINSRIMISTPDDRLIGEVQQEWHLIRRRYNLFTVEHPESNHSTSPSSDSQTSAISTEKVDPKTLNRAQFAHIDGGFLALDFDMQDEQGYKMASVNRNFVGFARELFTDSGQYVLRFDAAVVQDLQLQQGLGFTTAPAPTAESSSAEMEKAKEIQANKDEQALAQLEDRGGLTLDQRAIMLACAVSIDFDYFSRHSGNGGIMPMMYPMGGAPVPSSAENPAGAVIGAGAGAGAGQVFGGMGGEAGAGAGEMPSSSPGGEDSRYLGDVVPNGDATNDWGEDVWSEDGSAPEDSAGSWLGGLGDLLGGDFGGGDFGGGD
ncbi:hypothetical protein BGW38_001916 [Lunasporangiospora selenospora]|uniref:Scramblase n=1 Tax=Lunasporangiospora selenospora TaxID=979761 RepID=A0A9P6KDR5_9FUNG|nr:hypothetical protein BGW38_001916 [Lunasporangiospora selenospora]